MRFFILAIIFTITSVSVQASSFCRCDERFGNDKIVVVVGKSDPNLNDSQEGKFVLNEYILQPGDSMEQLFQQCVSDVKAMRSMGVCK